MWQFTRDSFKPDFSGNGPAISASQLRCGHWLVEADRGPPPSHQPARLLADVAGQSAIAISLASATLLELNLVTVVVSRLSDAGCVLGEPFATLALHEVLLNAVIHGNLGVASGPAAAWRDLALRETLIAAALADAALAGRLVTLAIGWGADRITVVVADEGAGWDVVAPQQGTTGAAGRGLMIARAAARVEVLDGGRCTKLQFERLPPVPPR